MDARVGDWFEIPVRLPGEVQRVGKVVLVDSNTIGDVYRLHIRWEPVDLPGGQRIDACYSERDIASGFIRPLNVLDRIARET